MKYLFGVPSAGAGPREYENWPEVIGGGLVFQVVPYQKGFAHKGEFITDLKQAARVVADGILEIIASDIDTFPESDGDLDDFDIYMFGHCMGASVAYETACLLAKEHRIHIKGLFISAFTSPDVPILDGISGLEDDAFLEEIHGHGTFPEEFFENKSLAKMFLPRIKADYFMIEHYVDREHYKLDCPIVGFFGKEDESVTSEKIAGWADYTTASFVPHYFPGNHYFYYEKQPDIINIIKEFTINPLGSDPFGLIRQKVTQRGLTPMG